MSAWEYTKQTLSKRQEVYSSQFANNMQSGTTASTNKQKTKKKHIQKQKKTPNLYIGCNPICVLRAPT